MLDVRSALDRVLAEVPLQPAEEVPLDEALGRVLGAEVRAALDVPRWDNSAMDGYALRAADTADGEVTLRLLELVGAGEVPTARVTPGTAIGIMTGAPVPEGCDTVVRVEDTDASREGTVRVRGKAPAGRHIRRRGEDVAAGALLLEPGETLGFAHLGALASQGRRAVEVRRRPRIALLSTGDEVVLPGAPLGPGQLYSSNNATLAALVREAGGAPIDLGNAPDDLDAIVGRLREALDVADAVCTTGGVSVGAYDHVKEALSVVGVAVDFWKVRMKPGKPLAYGRSAAGVPVFGLPGNPVSCAVNFLEFVRPWIRHALGVPRPFLPVLDAVAGEELRIRPGRLNLVRVRLAWEQGHLVARSTGMQSSAVMTTLAAAHGFALLEGQGVARGEGLRVQLLDPSFLDRADPGLP